VLGFGFWAIQRGGAVASSGFGSFGLCMWGGEGLQDTVWDSNGWLISCGFANFEG
jgi:hypothetical protein